MTTYRLLVFLHVLAAAIWVGGLVYLAAVVVPAVRRLGFGDRERQRLFSELGRRMRVTGWAALLTLVVSGATMAGLRGITLGAFLDPGAGNRFLVLLRAKVGLVAVVLGVLLAHDLLGAAASRAAPGSERAARLRAWSSWLGRIVTLLSVAVIYYAVRLVRG